MAMSEISVRHDDVGGSVAQDVFPPPEKFTLTTSRILILIHGYNNTLKNARESYGEFLKNSGLDGMAKVGQVCGFFWPGDKDLSVFSFLSYPLEVTPAIKSAEALHRFLSKLKPPGGWPLEVIIVCHSLGNRVGLELIKKYISENRPGNMCYQAACLMAAAVPVSMVEDPGNLLPAALEMQRSLVLYSASDAVLHWAFPVGQTAAGEGFFPRAVGRFGEPSVRLWDQRCSMVNYGHGDYWFLTESADAVRQFLGLAVENKLAESAIPEHSLPKTADLRVRELPDRAVQTRTSVTFNV